MIQEKTVFVVGAGASKELGLPLGAELMKDIPELLDFRWEFGSRMVGKGDRDILHALHQIAGKDIERRNIYTNKCRTIAHGIGFTTSIDNYINLHGDDEHIKVCGKLAIAKAILKAERNSVLYLDPHMQESSIRPQSVAISWFFPFIQFVTMGVPLARLDSLFNNLIIVCFNYDRCIEHFVVNALQPLYSIDQGRAIELVSKLQIYHPYGVVGDLPTSRSNGGIAFGSHEREDLQAIANRIRTFTEQIEEKETIESIRSEIESAEKLVFLGFGYYRQNMELLAIAKSFKGRVFGTAYNTSVSDMAAISSRIRQTFRIASKAPDPILENMTCKQFLEGYSRSIADI